MVAMLRSTPTVSRRHYGIALEIAQTHRILKKIRPTDFKRTVRMQSRILDNDKDRALKALAVLIPGEADRHEFIGILRRIALSDGMYSDKEKALLEKISSILKSKKAAA
jgi:tellurite resistance protein